MKRIVAALCISLFTLTACGQPMDTHRLDAAVYVNITAEEAKTIMDTEEGYVLLDVRTQEEYDEGHIAGALLIPHDTIAAKADDLLPDKHQTLLIYCRSGRRSKLAAETLVELGYTDIREFGGIIDWPYDIVQ